MERTLGSRRTHCFNNISHYLLRFLPFAFPTLPTPTNGSGTSTSRNRHPTVPGHAYLLEELVIELRVDGEHEHSFMGVIACARCVSKLKSSCEEQGNVEGNKRTCITTFSCKSSVAPIIVTVSFLRSRRARIKTSALRLVLFSSVFLNKKRLYHQLLLFCFGRNESGRKETHQLCGINPMMRT